MSIYVFTMRVHATLSADPGALSRLDLFMTINIYVDHVVMTVNLLHAGTR